MSTRLHWLLATLAGIATAVGMYAILQNRWSVQEVWTVAAPVPQGARLHPADVAARSVHGPTRVLLTPRSLPGSAGDDPEEWVALRALRPGDVLQEGVNVAPKTGAIHGPTRLRLVALPLSGFPDSGTLNPGTPVDIFLVRAGAPPELLLGGVELAGMATADGAPQALVQVNADLVPALLRAKYSGDLELVPHVAGTDA